jgi:hypothetical protein
LFEDEEALVAWYLAQPQRSFEPGPHKGREQGEVRKVAIAGSEKDSAQCKNEMTHAGL